MTPSDRILIRKRVSMSTVSNAVSDASSNAARAGQNVSPAARAAIGRAVDELRPYTSSDPRVAGLVTRLEAIAHVAKAEKLATELEAVYKAEWDADREEPLSVVDHAAVQQATSRAQLAYLRQMSPAAAAALESRAKWNIGR